MGGKSYLLKLQPKPDAYEEKDVVIKKTHNPALFLTTRQDLWASVFDNYYQKHHII